MRLSGDNTLDVKVKREGEDEWTDVSPSDVEDASDSNDEP
jgi:hypothetical protein